MYVYSRHRASFLISNIMQLIILSLIVLKKKTVKRTVRARFMRKTLLASGSFFYFTSCSLFDVNLPVPLLAAVEVFMPEFFSISMSSQRNALMSCLISFTSSSVTPSLSAFRCSTVTYRLTKFLMMLWYLKSRSEACLTFRWGKNQKSKPLSLK